MSAPKAKRGRPAVIHATTSIVVRVPPVLRAAIVKAAKGDGATLAETARELIKVGLAARGVKPGKS